MQTHDLEKPVSPLPGFPITEDTFGAVNQVTFIDIAYKSTTALCRSFIDYATHYLSC